MSTTISSNIRSIEQSLRDAEQQFARVPGSVRLLAVSKKQPLAAIQAAYAAGVRDFGENYLQEAVSKIQALTDCPQITWHYIGAIQSNKTREIATHFNWVHTVDRLKIAQRLSQQRPRELPALNICIQVNISQEASKAGMSVEALPQLAKQVARLPRLQLRGLMVLPAPSEDFERQRQVFRQCRELYEKLSAQGLALDTLSMGMSQDFRAAIAEGANWVRIGTAIFGARS
jgi:pyridoxal phosphate enzyme (YggS family)